MLTIDIRTNFDAVERTLSGMRRDLGDKAVAAALNKTMDKGRTQMKREITSEYAIPAASVNARLAVRRATAKGYMLTAVLEAFASSRRGRSLNLIHFVEQRVTLAEARRRRKSGTLSQLRFKIKRTGGLRTVSGAFIGNNGRTVFKRIGRSRLPIEPVQTIDIPQMFNAKRINDRVVARIKQEFPVEFARAARMVMARYGA